ncbi:potassium voltage-gated channel subfamily KQT member 4-like isoform X5, partial [Dinothrombium tinctorium]
MAARLFTTLSSGRPYDQCTFASSPSKLTAKFDTASARSATNTDGSRESPQKQRFAARTKLNSILEDSKSREAEENNRTLEIVDMQPQKKSITCRAHSNNNDGKRGSSKPDSVLRKTDSTNTRGSTRSQNAPRMSLFGRPIQPVSRQRTRDQRIRKYQLQLHNFLERPRGTRAVLYHMCV